MLRFWTSVLSSDRSQFTFNTGDLTVAFQCCVLESALILRLQKIKCGGWRDR